MIDTVYHAARAWAAARRALLRHDDTARPRWESDLPGYVAWHREADALCDRLREAECALAALVGGEETGDG